MSMIEKFKPSFLDGTTPVAPSLNRGRAGVEVPAIDAAVGKKVGQRLQKAGKVESVSAILCNRPCPCGRSEG